MYNHEAKTIGLGL